MEEKYISFETSKLFSEKIKEFNLDMSVKSAYREDGKIVYGHPDLSEFDYYPRPTQAQLHDYLLTKHEINVFIYPKIGAKCGYDTYPILAYGYEVLRKVDIWDYPMFDFCSQAEYEEGYWDEPKRDTYSEAMEAGLLLGLNYIK